MLHFFRQKLYKSATELGEEVDLVIQRYEAEVEGNSRHTIRAIREQVKVMFRIRNSRKNKGVVRFDDRQQDRRGRADKIMTSE